VLLLLSENAGSSGEGDELGEEHLVSAEWPTEKRPTADLQTLQLVLQRLSALWFHFEFVGAYPDPLCRHQVLSRSVVQKCSTVQRVRVGFSSFIRCGLLVRPYSPEPSPSRNTEDTPQKKQSYSSPSSSPSPLVPQTAPKVTKPGHCVEHYSLDVEDHASSAWTD
jgi:hypothetical protein